MSLESPIAVPGVRNLRDIGGLRAADGRITATRRLYRAELLTDRSANESNAVWTDAADDAVTTLGLATVIDLRSQPELDVSPSRWVREGTTHVHVPIDDGAPGSESDLMAAVVSGAKASFTVEDLGNYYLAMLHGRANELGRGIRTIAESDGPVLVHCSAGKDRTGVLVAVALEIVGVDRETVLDDYVETGIRTPDRVSLYADMLESRGLTADQVRPMFETPRTALSHALESAVASDGSIAEFFINRAALTAEDVERLRAALLTEEPGR
ncbi:tyrosine-protein phosphatase [Microbacterium aurum]